MRRCMHAQKEHTLCGHELVELGCRLWVAMGGWCSGCDELDERRWDNEGEKD